ncbi:MAG: glycosyltransferase family 4 protein [Sedimentisphaerales bacterium]|nr:glycosyltransferase family 4 protein [Sedimentisphaerales bacterium]
MPERVGFVSTRFAGLDGVSLESAKWARVFWDYEHTSYWYAGRLDRDAESSYCVPEAFFGHPENMWIDQQIWGRGERSRLVTRRIHELADFLKETLYDFVKQHEITMLVLENAVAIPMHVPLGLALAELLAETRLPAIAHHHDFYWERSRFSVSAVEEYLDMAFPPRDPELQHVVINLKGQEELSRRKGVSSLLIPNVLDFENPPEVDWEYTAGIREEIGLEPGDVMILQPTRIVPRKGIEHSIKLVSMLNDPKYKLVISHEAGDEGLDYRRMLEEEAQDENVDLRFISTMIGDYRQISSQGKKIYTLWDLYPHADLVTYPSLYEGFGNALLEAFYFKVPVVINRYDIFARDIEPKGFRLPIMDGYPNRRVAEEVRHILEDKQYREEMTEFNYQLASKFYSYSVLRRSLRTLVTNVTGLSWI